MQTILQILERAGGWRPGLWLRIDNAPLMELVIEVVDESGPCGFPALSLTHYGEENGDAMRDPEMLFELEPQGGHHIEPLPRKLGTLAAKTLASQSGANPGAADWRRFGRAPGFTNRKPRHRETQGLYPFVRLVSHSRPAVSPS